MQASETWGRLRGLTGARLTTAAGWALLVPATLVFLVNTVVFGGYFVEDAHITFRYAENLADGYGFVWNIGQAPVEGYTSFLHVVFLALGLKIGLSISAAALILSFASVAGLILAYLWLMRRVAGGVGPVALIILAVYLVDPRLAIHTISGLDTVPYMAVLAASCAVSVYFLDSPSKRGAILLAAVNLLSLWTRPDAGMFVFGQLVVLGSYGVYRWLNARDVRPLAYAALSYGLLFVIGSGYLLWKHAYFGSLLPTAFYIKSNQGLTLDGLAGSLEFAKSLLGMYAAVLAIVLPFINWRLIGSWLRSPEVWARVAMMAVPPVLFLLYYVTVLPEVNYLNRFQYPAYLLISAVVAVILSRGWSAPAADVAPEPSADPAAGRLGQLVLRGTCMVVGLVLLATVYRSSIQVHGAFRTMETNYYLPIGQALRDTGLGGRATLVFESAGVVPHVSEFSHIDPVGLTDNVLSGRVPISAWERERHIWGSDPDVYIGVEPPAATGASDCASDAMTRTAYVQRLLNQRYQEVLPYRRTYGALPPDERCAVLQFRMRELRDRWTLLGEIPFPSGILSEYRSLAYVRNDSPHYGQLRTALGPLVTRGPNQLNLEGTAELLGSSEFVSRQRREGL
jgi:hypothetical protein